MRALSVHSDQLPSALAMLVTGERRLTDAEFQQLAAVPAAVEWFTNIDNSHTRRACQHDLEDFCGFVGIIASRDRGFCAPPSFTDDYLPHLRVKEIIDRCPEIHKSI